METNEMWIWLAGQLIAAAAIYGGIRMDIRHIHKEIEHLYKGLEKTHDRVDRLYDVK